jgi:hypothetical protein
VALTVVVLLASAAVRSRPSTTESVLTYVDEIRPAVQTSTDQGADLADVRTHALTLGRDGLARRLDRLVAGAARVLNETTAVSAPKSLRVAHAFLVTALAERSRAAGEARGAVAAALAQGPPDPAVSGLVAAGQDLVLGDRAYQLFMGALPSRPLASAALPVSSWVGDPSEWAPPEATAFVASLRSSLSITPVHDLSVLTFTTDPAAVGTDNGADVIPPTSGLEVAIVVANVGNVAEHHATVMATLVTNGTNTSESVRDFVDLGPGQRLALTLGHLHPVSGTTGTLSVSISAVEGETDLANNVLSRPVELR